AVVRARVGLARRVDRVAGRVEVVLRAERAADAELREAPGRSGRDAGRDRAGHKDGCEYENEPLGVHSPRSSEVDLRRVRLWCRNRLRQGTAATRSLLWGTARSGR